MVLLKDMKIPREGLPKHDGDDSAARIRFSECEFTYSPKGKPPLTREEFEKKYPRVPGQWTEYSAECPEGRRIDL